MTILKEGNIDKVKEMKGSNTIYFECDPCNALFTAAKHEVKMKALDLSIHQLPATYYEAYCPCRDSYVETSFSPEKYKKVKQKILNMIGDAA